MKMLSKHNEVIKDDVFSGYFDSQYTIDVIDSQKIKKRFSGKKIGCLIILLIPVLLYFGFFFPVYKDVPKGYTSNHHTYREALACARSIDANAEVYTDYTEKQYNDTTQRVWKAKINGVDCQVASVPESFWADTIFRNNLLIEWYQDKYFYFVATDYYFSEIPALTEKYPDLGEATIYYGTVRFRNTFDKMDLNDFDRVWNEYKLAYDEITNKNPTIKVCELWTNRAGDKDYDMTYTYHIENTTEDQYVKTYNKIVINDVMKDRNGIIRDGSTSVHDPHAAWTKVEYFAKGTDKDNVITKEKLKALWEEYRTLTDELKEASPYINNMEIMIDIQEDCGYYYPHAGLFTYTDASEKTYEKAYKELAEFMP